MTVNQCCEQLIEVEAKRGGGICGPDALAVGLARVASVDQCVVYGTLQELSRVDFGGPLHSLVLVGETDHIEQDMLDMFKITPETPLLPEVEEEDEWQSDEGEVNPLSM